MARKLRDLTGQRHGRLTVMGFSHMRNESSYWHVKCDCGNKKTMIRQAILSGRTKSCGCYGKQIHKDMLKTHGMSKTPLYKCWEDMIQRCNNSNSKNFKYYGARGISVCDEWK